MTSEYKELQKEAKRLGLQPFGMNRKKLEQAIQDIKEGKRPRSKSSIIREKLDQGKTVAEIAREQGYNYAFVYGVAQRHAGGDLKKVVRKETTSDKIRELHDQGMTRNEIRKKLGIDYAFVHSVVKRYKEQMGEE